MCVSARNQVDMGNDCRRAEGMQTSQSQTAFLLPPPSQLHPRLIAEFKLLPINLSPASEMHFPDLSGAESRKIGWLENRCGFGLPERFCAKQRSVPFQSSLASFDCQLFCQMLLR
jgi:hypothetical protein